MGEKGIGDLLLESRQSKLVDLGKQNSSTFHWSSLQWKKKGENEEDDSIESEKDYRQLQTEYFLKCEQVQRNYEIINDYRRREIEIRQHQKRMEEKINRLEEKNHQLTQEMQLLKHNHQSQVQFLMKRQKETLTTISSLLSANQVQRMGVYIQNQLSHVQLESRQSSNITDSQSFLLEKGNQTQNFLHPNLQEFVRESHKKIQEIGIDVTNVNRLPQMKKLAKEKEIIPKKLAWYLTQQPFEFSRHKSEPLAEHLLKLTPNNSGSSVLNTIIQLVQRNLLTVQPTRKEKRKSDITHFKSEMSELIESNTISKLRTGAQRKKKYIS